MASQKTCEEVRAYVENKFEGGVIIELNMGRKDSWAPISLDTFTHITCDIAGEDDAKAVIYSLNTFLGLVPLMSIPIGCPIRARLGERYDEDDY